MLHLDDIEAAVKSGVLSRRQADALREQAAARAGSGATKTSPGATIVAPAVAEPPPIQASPGPARGLDDETFGFARGFNDVFLAVGVILIALALFSQWSPTTGNGLEYLAGVIVVLWLISELLVAWKRAVLPGIAAVLAICLASAAIAGTYAWNRVGNGLDGRLADGGSWFGVASFPLRVWAWANLASGAAAAVYFARFRLPFALLPMGLCAVLGAQQLLFLNLGLEQSLRLSALLGLAMGVGLFAVAMTFDMSDPERRTRRADCGFWLHLAAAPLIVHPLVNFLTNPAGASPDLAALLTIVTVVPLVLVALAIDRRALLISSLFYLIGAIGYLVTSSRLIGQISLPLALFLIGTLVIVAGLGWHRLRALVIWPISGTSLARKLPPVRP